MYILARIWFEIRIFCIKSNRKRKSFKTSALPYIQDFRPNVALYPNVQLTLYVLVSEGGGQCFKNIFVPR